VFLWFRHQTFLSTPTVAAAMPQASKIWQKVLKQVQQLPTVHQEGGSVSQGAGPLNRIHLDVLGPLETGFLKLDRVSSSEWKKLVVELKVITWLSFLILL
jgi:hypothetical protein